MTKPVLVWGDSSNDNSLDEGFAWLIDLLRPDADAVATIYRGGDGVYASEVDIEHLVTADTTLECAMRAVEEVLGLPVIPHHPRVAHRSHRPLWSPTDPIKTRADIAEKWFIEAIPIIRAIVDLSGVGASLPEGETRDAMDRLIAEATKRAEALRSNAIAKAETDDAEVNRTINETVISFDLACDIAPLEWADQLIQP